MDEGALCVLCCCFVCSTLFAAQNGKRQRSYLGPVSVPATSHPIDPIKQKLRSTTSAVKRPGWAETLQIGSVRARYTHPTHTYTRSLSLSTRKCPLCQRYIEQCRQV
uniref:Secreted peptide n=1 Tax=Anopheles braziliensis TaxID=58242 RepID=A0A2M3ZLH8_9DIPT